jgi:hypothetical protein
MVPTVARFSSHPLALPLGDLLRHRTLSTRSCSSTPLPLFLGCSPARLSCRVRRHGRSTFVGWGGVMGELTVQPVVAQTLEIRPCPRARKGLPRLKEVPAADPVRRGKGSMRLATWWRFVVSVVLGVSPVDRWR